MSFVTTAFKQPLPSADEWTHHDIYPDFDIYGYHVQSNLKRAGFISLKHVKPTGFGIETRKWLPDGPSLDSVTIEVTTPPLYAPNAMMHVIKLRTDAHVAAESNMKADGQGRLHFFLDGASYELGITPAGSPYADVIAVDYVMPDKKRYLKPGDNTLRISILNRGSMQHGVTLSITSTDSSVSITPSTIKLPAGKRLFDSNAITIRCNKPAPADAAPPFVRLRVDATIVGDTNSNEFVIPVMYDAPAFNNLTIDDRRKVNDSTEVRGTGNGNGIPEPGERVVLYADGHPLKMYSDNPLVVAKQETGFDIMVPAKWPDGFTLASVIKIADDCPEGTELVLLGNYETKEFMPIKRKVDWGKVWRRGGQAVD
jgi:hypothetical protein